MESQAPHPVGHTYDQDPHSVGLHSSCVCVLQGVEDEGHEHKSVLKKVKDKAKKIKHKLHLDGHEHEHELEHDYAGDARGGYEEEDDEDEEDGEMVQDPEIQGAPVYESAAIRSSTPAQPQAPNFENPTATPDYPRTPAGSMKDQNPGLHGEEETPRIGVLKDLQEDPHGPNPAGGISPPNYESKVADPTGEPGKAADIDPSLITSLDKMTVSDQVPGKQETAYTGSHDQLAPQRTPIGHELCPVTSGQGSGYVEKISVATSLIADKAISAKNAVASKLGYGDKPQPGENTGPGASEYVQKVAAPVTGTLAPVYEKVVDAGSSMVSKVKGGSGSGSGGGAVRAPPDKGVSVTDYLAEKLRPGDDDKALSDMISDTLHLSKVSDVVKAGESHPTPVGRVTESEEVRRDLGSGMENKREGELAIAAGKENTGGGSGVMDRVKGAVTSWMGKQWEQGSGTADSPSHVGNEGAEVGEKAEFGGDQERRLQGSDS